MGEQIQSSSERGAVSSPPCCAYDCTLTTTSSPRRFLHWCSWRRDFCDRADHLARGHCTWHTRSDATWYEPSRSVYGYRCPRIPRRTGMHPGARGDHREHDRKGSGASAARCDRCRHGVRRDINHMVPPLSKLSDALRKVFQRSTCKQRPALSRSLFCS